MKDFKHTQRLYRYSGYTFTVFAATALLLSWFDNTLFAILAKISSTCALALLIFTLFMVPIALIFDCRTQKEEKQKIVWLALLVFVLVLLVAIAIFLSTH